MALKDTNKGKLIYQPQGPAGEYAKWAVNLHNGCTHGCTYCYNRRGVLSHAFGEQPKYASIIVKRAKMLYDRQKDTCDPGSLDVLMRDCHWNAIDDIIASDITNLGADRLRKDGGVFFSFKCDPMEGDNMFATYLAARWLCAKNIPVTILTKSTEWMEDVNWQSMLKERQDLLTIGFTLTGMDDMEVNAPSTSDRVAALEHISKMSVKTFVSLEPVIDLNAARKVVATCCDYTKEFRIGLQSPYKKDRYDITELKAFINAVTEMQVTHRFEVIWKDSVFNYLDRHGVQYKRYSRPKGCVLTHLE